MQSTDTGKLDAHALSTVLEISRRPTRHIWDAADLAEMWQHQLSTPLTLSLGHLCGEASHHLADGRHDPRLTLAQLLSDPAPALALLRLVHRFAKTCREDRESSLPRELVLLMYYASIIAAVLRCGERISGLADPPLLKGLRWFNRKHWVDGPTRELLSEGTRVLGAGSGD